MFYVINRENSEGQKEVVLCKASGCQEAKRMSDVPDVSSAWACFTEQQVTALIESREGHIVKKL